MSFFNSSNNDLIDFEEQEDLFSNDELHFPESHASFLLKHHEELDLFGESEGGNNDPSSSIQVDVEEEEEEESSSDATCIQSTSKTGPSLQVRRASIPLLTIDTSGINNAGKVRNLASTPQVVDSGEKSNNEDKHAPSQQKQQPAVVGRWTHEEHELFLEGLQKYGKSWKKIAEMIKTRTLVQIRTHAQKYLQKKKWSGLDNTNSSSPTSVSMPLSIAYMNQVHRMNAVAAGYAAANSGMFMSPHHPPLQSPPMHWRPDDSAIRLGEYKPLESPAHLKINVPKESNDLVDNEDLYDFLLEEEINTATNLEENMDWLAGLDDFEIAVSEPETNEAPKCESPFNLTAVFKKQMNMLPPSPSAPKRRRLQPCLAKQPSFVPPPMMPYPGAPMGYGTDPSAFGAIEFNPFMWQQQQHPVGYMMK